MDILLVARNTMFNSMVRKITNSPWGHSSVVINNTVYDFDIDGKFNTPLEDVILDTSVHRATLFYLEMFGVESESEELYKELFNTGHYDIELLSNTQGRTIKGRNLENIQSDSNLYTCSSLIAKVYYDSYGKIGLVPNLLRDIHWTQIIPNDYSNLEFKEDFI